MSQIDWQYQLDFDWDLHGLHAFGQAQAYRQATSYANNAA